MDVVSEEEVRRAVRERYSRLAMATDEESCGTGSCCAQNPEEGIPDEARRVGAGCGSPVEKADIRDGMLVVDLGSGGGIDVFRAAKLVGERGRVVGVDSTPEMVWRARETARKYAYENVEFRLGELEHLPLESDSVDLAMSNCVVNLTPDKERVFKEIHRVLKRGGTFVISDVVTKGRMPKKIAEDLPMWSRCISGASQEKAYLQTIKRAGFDFSILERKAFAMPELGAKAPVMSVTIRGRKLAGSMSEAGPSRPSVRGSASVRGE